VKKMSSAYWQSVHPEIEVVDPDGWDRMNLAESWAEPITEDEWRRRAMNSTCRFTVFTLAPNGPSAEPGGHKSPEG